MPADPEVSVIVPVRDAGRTLPALLASLDRQTLARERFEVVVVDNASRDESGAIAAARGARVVQEPVPNRARARNVGAAAAHADLFAYTDGDCVAAPTWLEALLSHARTGPQIFAGAVVTTTSPHPNAVERFEALWRFNQGAWVKQGWAATANLCASREVHDAIGGFDPAYPHTAEDADFCVRAARSGYELGYCAEAVVEHPGEDHLWPMLKRLFFHGYGSNQAQYRLGYGHRAWRHPGPALAGDAALGQIGVAPGSLPPGEWRTMRRLGRLAYGARILGSLWAELRRAR